MANPALGGLASSGGRSFFVTSIVFQVLAAVAVGCRIWAKTKLRRKFQAHDYFMFAALVFGIGETADTLTTVCPGGSGLHMKDAIATLEPWQLTATLKGYFASQILWAIATTMTKLSVLHLYLGIFNTTPLFVYIAYTLIVCCVLFMGSFILTAFLMCHPIAFNWDKTLDGHCGNETLEVTISASANMILDLAIVILPLPILWKLHLPLKKKLVLMGMLSLGTCICAMNLTRVVLEATADAADFTYGLVNAGLFSNLEICIGIISGCLPTFGPLVYRTNFKPSAQGYKYNNESNRRPKPSFKNPAIQDTVYITDLEEQMGDHVPLREVIVHGGSDSRSDASAVEHRGEGIRVKTDVQLFSSRIPGGETSE